MNPSVVSKKYISYAFSMDQCLAAAGPRFWTEISDNVPEGWGFRFTVTLLFPN